jgi:hypothetical protein
VEVAASLDEELITIGQLSGRTGVAHDGLGLLMLRAHFG